jgi:hypothetical protein
MKNMISYNPISEKEIHDWYINMDFSLILDDVNYDLIKTARLSNMEDDNIKEYIKTMKIVSKTTPNAVFDTTHGFLLAKVQTYFRKCYTVNTSFSDLIKEKEFYIEYTKPWELIIEPENSFSFLNTLSESTSSGVYIPSEKVVQLLKDYKGNLLVKKDLDNFFGNNLNPFLESLRFSKENNLGLLEAIGVVKDKSITETNTTEIASDEKLIYKNEELLSVEQKEKKSILSRLFGSR